MTTIAYDGKTLATDSCITSGGMKFGTLNKIIKLKTGNYLTGAGSIDILYAVADWLNGTGEIPVLGPEDSFCGILVAPSGEAQEISTNLRLVPACIPWTGGSGEHIAMAVLKCGHDAVKAIEIACQLDIMTSGPINTITIKQRKKK